MEGGNAEYRLEDERDAARLQVEQLRMLCVTQRWLLDVQGRGHQSGAVDLRIAVRDALAFFDRVNASKSEWTADDVLRLQQLRAIAARVTQ